MTAPFKSASQGAFTRAPARVPDRIVVINDSSVARGGATGLAILSARLLRERRLAVTYVAGDAGGAPELEAAGVKRLTTGGARLLAQSKWKSATSGLWNGAARALLAQVVAEDTPGTIYHVHGWAQILSPAIFAALAPVAPRVVIHAHDRFLACPNGAYYNFKAEHACDLVPMSASCLCTNCDKQNYPRKLWRAARQAVLRRTFRQDRPWGAIALIHPAMAPLMEMAGYPSERLMTLRNPAEPFTPTRIRAEENRAFAFVGRVVHEKGIDMLAAAARRTETPLMVIGEGPLQASLSYAYPEIAFAGWQDRAGIARLLSGARAMVMPGRLPEPFGLVAAEASLSGLPVAISSTALLAEEITAGGLGFSFDLAAEGALDAALLRLRDMPDTALKLISERGFSRAAPIALTPNEWTNGLLHLYAGLLDKR